MHRTPEGYLQAIARGSEEPLLSVSPSGRVIWWGHVAEALFGYTREEAVGRPVLALVVHPASIDVVTQALQSALQLDGVTCAPTWKHRDGTSLPHALTVRVERRDESGAPELVIVAAPRAGAAAAHVLAPPRPSGERVPVVSVLEGEPSFEGLEVRIGRAFLTSHDPHVLLARLGQALVPAFADGFGGFLIEPDGRTRLAAQVGTGVADLAEEGATERYGRDVEGGLLSLLEGEGERIALRMLGRTRPLGSLVLDRARSTFAEEERAWATALARRVAMEVENIRLADLAQRAREEARRANLHMERYERLTGALSEATTPPQVLDAVLEQAGALLGATGGAVALLAPDRTSLEVVAATAGADALTNAKRALPVSARVPLAEAARSGQPLRIEYVRAAVPQYEHLSGLPERALDSAVAAMPLVFKGRSIGALGLTFPGRREFSPEDATTLQALARHAADAMERVRLYEAERRARAEAGEEARRLELLADTSRILADTLDWRRAAGQLVQKLVPAVADWCVFYELRGGQLEPGASFHRDLSKLQDLSALARAAAADATSPVGVGKVIATGRPVLFFSVPDGILPGIASDAEQLQRLRNVGVTSQMMVPVATHAKLLGVLVVTYTGFRRYEPTDVVFVETIARRVAVALENARLLEESQASEERYRLLVDGVRDYALFFLDPEGRVATWSPAAERLFGYTEEEAVGLQHEQLYLPEEIARGRPARNRGRAAREGRYEEDGIRLRKDGSPMWVNVVITALRDDDGSLRGFALLMRDNTEAVRAREALERARAQLGAAEKLSALGSLVSGVAHEIRTPLTAMSNNLHILDIRLRNIAKKEPRVPVSPLLDQVQGAIEGVDRLNRLVEDLRKFARVKAGTHATVPLDVPVQDALRLFAAAHRGRLDIVSELDPTPPLDLDVLQVQQVVLNLLQNASESMPQGGRVHVRTRATDGGAELVIEDEGEGMPSDVQARMFEEFFTTKPQGTGLGLSIVRRIVEAHHGTIRCESEPGKGTRFTITLAQRGF